MTIQGDQTISPDVRPVSVGGLGELLRNLSPGEQRTMRRTIEPDICETRFLNVEPWLLSRLRWQDFRNGTLVPTPPFHINHDVHISVHDLPETPVFFADPQLKPFTEYFPLGFARVLSERVLNCVLQLDPGGIEYREVVLSGEPMGSKYYLAMGTRVLDAVDLERTNVELRCSEVPGDPGRFFRRAVFPGGGVVGQGGYSIRNDLPDDIHIFVERSSGATLCSRTLWETVVRSGAKGLCAKAPENFIGQKQLMT